MSEIIGSIIHAKGAIRIGREGAETPIDVPASGVLVLHEYGGASVTIGGGGATEIVGIKYIDSNGNDVVIERDQSDEKFLRTAPGVSVTIKHGQTTDLLANAIPADQQILTSTGNDVVLSVENTPAIKAYAIAPINGFRWGVVDRKGYVATTAADWDPEPTTVWAALDQLAAGQTPVAEGSAILTSGVPEPLWTMPLAEGQVFGGKVTIVGIATDGPDTLRSIISAEFVASRSTGQSASLTTVSVSENGTLPGGTPTLEASGNDIVLSITATFNGDFDWKAAASLHTLP